MTALRRAAASLALLLMGSPAATAQEGFADDAAIASALATRTFAIPELSFDAAGADGRGPWVVDSMWNADATACLWRWEALDAPPTRLRIPTAAGVLGAAGDRRALVASVGGHVALVRADATPRELPLVATAAAFAGDDRLVVGGRDGALLVRLAPDGGVASVTSLGVGGVEAVALAAAVDRAALVLDDGRVVVVDVTAGEARRAAELEVGAAGPASAVALAPDGRALLVGHATGEVGAWDLAAATPREVGAAPGVGEGSAIRSLVLDAAGLAVAMTGAPGNPALLRLTPTGLRLVRRVSGALAAIPWASGLRTLRFDTLDRLAVGWAPPDGEVVVGGERVAWPPAEDAPRAAGWPWLTARASWDAGLATDAGPVVLEVEVSNAGAVGADWLVARLEPGRDGDVVAPPVHLGAIAPGATVRRTVRIARTSAMARGDLALRLVFDDPRGVAPTPVTWQHLPRTAGDAAAVDALAARIHAAAVDELRELMGDPTFDPALEPLPDGAVGFVTGRREDGRIVVRYQRPTALGAAGLEGDRRATGDLDRHEVERDAELMLWWYLPHEAVHAARRHLGLHGGDAWREEWVAATLQPALVARVLARLADAAPYDAAAIGRAVDRWVERLGRGLTRERRRRVEAFVTSGGATPADDEDAATVFERDVGLYVYLLSRTSQAAAARPEPLDELARRHLSR